MDQLPLNDVAMLVSAINFLLRDEEFDTLDEICFHFNINRAELEKRLATLLVMITKDSIEAAYCFFHQKWRVYKYSNSQQKKEEIEYAISSYVEAMSGELYAFLADDRAGFLLSHNNFQNDIESALSKLEAMI